MPASVYAISLIVLPFRRAIERTADSIKTVFFLCQPPAKVEVRQTEEPVIILSVENWKLNRERVRLNA